MSFIVQDDKKALKQIEEIINNIIISDGEGYSEDNLSYIGKEEDRFHTSYYVDKWSTDPNERTKTLYFIVTHKGEYKVQNFKEYKDFDEVLEVMKKYKPENNEISKR